MNGTSIKKMLSVGLAGCLLVGSISGCSVPSNTDDVAPSSSVAPSIEPVETSKQEGEYTYTNNMTMYDYKQDKMLYNEDGSLNLSADNLVDKWDMFKNAGNLYIQASTGEESYSVLLRNLNGESVVSSSDGAVAVYLKDNTMIYVKDGIYSGVDATFVDLLDFAVSSVGQGYGHLQATDLSDNAGGFAYEYVVDVMGYDDIHKLYANLGNDYADTLVNQFKENMTTENEDGTKDIADLNMRFAFVGGENGITSAGCYIYNGTEAVGIDEEGWSHCSSLWLFDGYYTIYDWELPELFYNFDYEDISEENGTKLYDETSGLLDNLGNLIKAYFDKYGNGAEADVEIGAEPQQTEEPGQTEPQQTNEPQQAEEPEGVTTNG